MNLPEDFQPGLPAEDQLDMSDKWVLSELAKMAADATANLDKYELGLAAEKVENFIWEVYCDWYIEICKTRLNGDDAQAVHHRGDLSGPARQRRDHHDPAVAGQ